jgi:hypothetical protein
MAQLTSYQARPILALHNILHSSMIRYLPQLLSAKLPTSRDLLHASSAYLAKFDSAACLFHAPQIATDIDFALRDLQLHSEDLISTAKAMIALSDHSPDLLPCLTLITRWEARLRSEMELWDQRLISMSSLRDAL